MAVKLVLSFDYELFLGNPSGTLNKSLLEPTEAILRIFNKYNKKGVFFVDATYLSTCRKQAPLEYKKVSEQVRRLFAEGHEIGLHLHPHWLDASFVDGKWYFSSFDKFRLHSLNIESLEQVFTDSIESLKDAVGDSSYSPVVYRAGGWCIQPFSLLKKQFAKHKLQIDSSVALGMTQLTGIHAYDYSMAPAKMAWRFSEDPIIPILSGEFIEVPVASVKLSGWDLFFNKLVLKLKRSKPFGDGKGVYGGDSSKKLLVRLFQENTRPFSIEGTSRWLLRRMLKKTSFEVVQFVMHPKTCSNESLKNLDYLLSRFDVMTVTDVAREYAP